MADVYRDLGAYERAERVGELLKASLLEYDPKTGRYALHDLLRLYLAARLVGEERLGAERNHAAFYLNILFL
jgi:hypothetical protein